MKSTITNKIAFFLVTATVSLHYRYILFIFNNQLHLYFAYYLFLGILAVLILKVFEGINQRDVRFKKSDLLTFFIAITLPIILNYYDFSLLDLFISVTLPLFLDLECLLIFKLPHPISKIRYNFNFPFFRKDYLNGANPLFVNKTSLDDAELKKAQVLFMESNSSNSSLQNNLPTPGPRFPLEALPKTPWEKLHNTEYLNLVRSIVAGDKSNSGRLYLTRLNNCASFREYIEGQHHSYNISIFELKMNNGKKEYKYITSMPGGYLPREIFKDLCTKYGTDYDPAAYQQRGIELFMRENGRRVTTGIITHKDYTPFSVYATYNKNLPTDFENNKTYSLNEINKKIRSNDTKDSE